MNRLFELESRHASRSSGPVQSQAWRWARFMMSGMSLVVALALSGCGNLRREARDRPGLLHRNPTGPESSGSTIGHDFRRVPAGTTIPATGFGVDLVRFHGGQSDQESGHAQSRTKADALTRTAHQSEPTQGQQRAQGEPDH
jgi:hypothetical protein